MTTTVDSPSGTPATPGSVHDGDTDLEQLYADFKKANMAPLWTQRDDLQPFSPQPRAVPFMWHWSTLYPLAQRAGDLVAVGRGGERRAIALANPGIPGDPYATPTLWAAIQYLGPRETAPAHRHVQTAFRFVVEGDGVWTNVEGDPIAMRRGDVLLTPSWHFHEHHNPTDHPMAWVDGLDIPLISQLDAGFFEYGLTTLATTATPAVSNSERLWGHPGMRPVSVGVRPNSPLMAYRWADTDAALRDQLELERAGQPGTVEPGHAAVRFYNPTTGGDALRTIRLEFHRLAAGAVTTTTQVVGSAVWTVFAGQGAVSVGDAQWQVRQGDIFAVPSWAPVAIAADDELDIFRFSDDPVFEALGLDRTQRTA